MKLDCFFDTSKNIFTENKSFCIGTGLLVIDSAIDSYLTITEINKGVMEEGNIVARSFMDIFGVGYGSIAHKISSGMIPILGYKYIKDKMLGCGKNIPFELASMPIYLANASQIWGISKWLL